MRSLFALAIVLGATFVSSPAHADATCETFDPTSAPARSFDAGDPIVVRGQGFAERSLALINFQQGARTAEIDRIETNDLGAFSTDPATSKLPDNVDEGAATIRVLQGSASADCEITMASTTTSSRGAGRSVYLIWGIVLTLAALVLGIATIRRWRAERAAPEPDPPPRFAPVAEGDGYEEEEDEYFELGPEGSVEREEEQETDEDRSPFLDEPDDRSFVPGASDAVMRLQQEARAWRRR